MNEDKMIECISWFGKKVIIPKSKLYFRPAVYGVIVHNNKILIAKAKSNGKYTFPGGAVDYGEELENGLKREVGEETGIEIEVLRFLYFYDQNLYYEPKDEAFNGYLYYYLCKPKTFHLLETNEINDNEAQKAEWVDITISNKDDFLAGIAEVVPAIRERILDPTLPVIRGASKPE